MNRSSRIRGQAALLASVVAVAGCAGPSRKDETVDHPAYTPSQAIRLAEQLPREVARHLSPHPSLELIPAGFGSAPCSGPDDTEDTGMVMHERTYWLRGITAGRNQDILAQTKEFWATNGYAITLDDKVAAPPRVWKFVAHNKENGFNLSLTQGAGGQLSIRAQSPCVEDMEGANTRPAT